MAEGVIIVPPDSTGKSLRTVTNAGVAAGAHQEVVTLADSAGTGLGTNANPVPVSAAGGSLTVDGTFWQATQPVSGTVTADTELEAAAVFADATANPTATRIGSYLFGWNGATWDRLKSSTANGLQVDVTRLPALVAGSAVIGHVIVDAGAAVIGHVITDTGSTTAVTGNVTVPGPYTEDAASVADPIGYQGLARRRDVPLITEVSAEGDVIA